jgi:hypothetical protein
MLITHKSNRYGPIDDQESASIPIITVLCGPNYRVRSLAGLGLFSIGIAIEEERHALLASLKFITQDPEVRASTICGSKKIL